MKRKIFSIFFVLMLVLGFTLVPATPVSADIIPITVTPDDYTAGVTTDYSITFTPATGGATDVTIDFSAFGITTTDMVLSGVSANISHYLFTGFASNPTGVTVDDDAKTIVFTTANVTASAPHTISNVAAGIGLMIINDQDAGTHDVTISTAFDSGTSALTIGLAPLDHIVVSPATASIPCGGSQTYTAEAFDQYDQSRGDVTANTTWGIEAGAGGGWLDNVYSAEYEGTWTVTGTYSGKSNTASLTVCVGVGGEAYLVDKLAILAPWLGLVLILVIGASVFIRRWQRAR